MSAVTITERTLPYSLDAERALLGAILLHGEAYYAIAEIIQPDDFFREAHRLVFAAMAKLVVDGSAIDLTTLRAELQRAGALDEVGGPAYIASLVDGVPRSTNATHYARILHEHATRRSVVTAANKILTDAYEAERPSGEVIDDAVNRLLLLAAPGASAPVRIGDAVRTYVESLDDAERAAKTVVPTGYHDLDELLGGGIRTEELTIVAARPGVGKTAFALESAMAAAKCGRPTVYVSLEMSTHALAERVISGTARIDGARLRGRFLGEHDWPKLTQAWSVLDASSLLVQESAATLAQIAATCHRLRQRPEGLACVVVDYLQLLAPDRGKASVRDEVTALSRGLKRLAKDQHLAVLALSQLSRAPEARNDKRPHLSDLRESGALEQDADLVLLLFREDMYAHAGSEQTGIAEVIVAKARNGPTGIVKLVFIRELTRFEDLASGG